MEPDDLTIPRWFLRLMSCVLGLAVPWAGWVTLQLATIEVKVEHAAQLQSQVQSRLHEHLADHEAHRADARPCGCVVDVRATRGG
jgi:hypothetical protein